MSESMGGLKTEYKILTKKGGKYILKEKKDLVKESLENFFKKRLD